MGDQIDMTTKFIQPGDVIEYVNAGSAIAAGAPIVIGKQIGIALVDIAATTGRGSVAMSGVFEVPKVSAAVWVQGENVIWDASTASFDDNLLTPATGDVTNCCIAWSAGANGETTGKVKINVGIGTVA